MLCFQELVLSTAKRLIGSITVSHYSFTADLNISENDSYCQDCKKLEFETSTLFGAQWSSY